MVPLGDDLIERLGLLVVESGKPQIVDNEQVRLEKRPDSLLIGPFVACDGESPEQLGRSDEEH
ncbi:hypothetical protein GMSM_16150 [Geomonas sp. Red276]